MTCQAEKIIPVWSYHQSPPFITGEGQGLTYDFVELLNRQLSGKYRLELTLMPRNRLDMYLASRKQGAVLFVNAKWMDDRAQTKYFWGPEIMADSNAIISPRKHPIVYDGTAKSLRGLVFAGVRGHYYVGLEADMRENRIHRIDTKSEAASIKSMLAGRVDVTSMPASTLKYFMKSMSLAGQIYTSPRPLMPYSRHIMLTKSLLVEHKLLQKQVLALKSNPDWKAILIKYGLLADPNKNWHGEIQPGIFDCW
ncbi:transporter substrate-binding domain-containing protein [Thalassomonas sp. RHCl1]|uniref:substrate-binding periplasmic protein n=1 Tax=Thalassomonas sp. RHCl1 TaxID=2995320 RepID=UPI0032B28ECB